MRLLIYSGVSPYQQDHWQQTPLHLACIKGDVTPVRELCELVSQQMLCRQLYFVGKLSWDVTTTHVNSALYRFRVA